MEPQFRPITEADLFNCCTNGAEPDWTQFGCLEVGGCRQEPGAPEGQTEGGQPIADAEFFTIYAIGHWDEREAITDAADLVRAIVIAAELGRRSNLPVHLARTLAHPDGIVDAERIGLEQATRFYREGDAVEVELAGDWYAGRVDWKRGASGWIEFESEHIPGRFVRLDGPGIRARQQTH